MSSGQRHIVQPMYASATSTPQITPPQTISQGYTEAAKNVFSRLRHGGARRPSTQSTPPEHIPHKLGPLPRQNTSYRSGLKLRALDINQARTHVVLAGGKILKTVRIDEIPSCTEDYNLRTAAVHKPGGNSLGQDIDSVAQLQQETLDSAALQRETFDIEDVAWSNNEFKDSIATAARNGKIMLYNINRPGMKIARLHEHLQQVHKVDFNPLEGGVLLSGSQDGTVRLWDLRSLEQNAMICTSRDTYHGRSQSVRHVKWSRTSTWAFAFSTDNGVVQRWDTRMNRSPLLKIIAHEGHCNTIDWHPDGKYLVSGGEDGMIKVWNMTSEEPRTKMVYSLRAPYGVQNVRWRPSCLVDDDSDSGIKQCTHLATSYKNYPLVHVWDLRRPFVPFREIYHSHNSGTTDMLWRSRDLLWTVGPEGEFNQIDVPFAPKTFDRRSTSTLAVSANGDININIMKRHAARHADDEDKSLNSREKHYSGSQSGGARAIPFSRSPGSDSIDDRFLAPSHSTRRSKLSGLQSGKKTGTTPPLIQETTKSDTVDFTITMQELSVIRVFQTSKVGQLPGAKSELIMTYMAQKYKAPPVGLSLDMNYITGIRKLFEQNAIYAQRASHYREAQTWRIIGFQIETDLRLRARLNKQRRGITKVREKDEATNRPEVTGGSMPQNTQLDELTDHKLADDISMMKSQKYRVTESSSNMSTPLAKPMKETHNEEADVKQAIGNVATDLQLPPSTLHERENGNRPPLTRHESSDSGAMFSMSAEADASIPGDPTARMVSSGSTRRGSTDSGELMQGDADSIETDPPFFKGSYDDPAPKMAAIAASTAAVGDEDLIVPPPVATAFEKLGHHQSQIQEPADEMAFQSTAVPTRPQIVICAPPNLAYLQSCPQEEGVRIEATMNYQEIKDATPEMPSSDGRLNLIGNNISVEDVLVLDDYMHTPSPNDAPQAPMVPPATAMLRHTLDFFIARGEFQVASQLYVLAASVLIPPGGVDSSPMPVSEMIASMTNNPITAAFLDHFTASPLNLPIEDAMDIIAFHHNPIHNIGMNPAQMESTLEHYHQYLLAANLHNAAALLRHHAYPAFPAVYEFGLIDVDIGLLCLECNNPINNKNHRICETCNGRQEPCCICGCYDSQFASTYTRGSAQRGTESPIGISASKGSAVGSDAGIWTCCLICNHSYHLVCAGLWFADPSADGACPTPACLCHCMPATETESKIVSGVEKDGKSRSVRGVKKAVGEVKERTVRFLEV